MAAPTATTSSGFTFLLDSLPKNFSTALCMAGILVIPPTSITSFISVVLIFASFTANLHGAIVCSTKSIIRFSNCDLEIVLTKCFGPEASAVIKGRFISLSITVESSILAFSAASRNL